MIKKLFQSEFIRNSSILIVGTVLAQIVPIAIQPIIRRIYTDAETGRFDLYISIVAILASFVHLNYARTVVIPKREDEAINLLGGSIFSSFILSLIIYIIMLFGGDFIIEKFNLPPAFLPWLKYVPLSVFFVGSYTSMSFWLTRKKQFKSIAFNKFVRRGSEGMAQIGLKQWSSNGLIVGSILGDCINFLIHTWQVFRSGFKWQTLHFSIIKEQFIKFKDFPLYSLLPSFLNTISSNLPVIIVTSLFSDRVAGQFGLSRMVLAIPLALISVAISQVLLQKIAEKRQNNQSIKQLLKGSFFTLSAMSLIGLVIVYFFSEPIFIFAFGDKWIMASKITSILVFYYIIYFVTTPLSIVFIALEKIKLNSIWQTFHFLLIFSLYLFKGVGIYEFMFYFMLINFISYLAYGILIYFTIKEYEKSLLE